MTLRLADFAGHWRLKKDIADILTGEAGTFLGRAEFREAEGGLSYHEDGQFTLGSAAPLRAERRYFWRSDGDWVAVDYPDGRPFHRFRAADPVALHLCDPDTYEVAYGLSGWPDWTAMWTVTGPRKDYRMLCDYRRAAA